MEELIYVDRRNSNCNKWDGQTAMFGEEGLHAMWVADMDFKIPQCVQKALHDYVDFGTVGYYRIQMDIMMHLLTGKRHILISK